MTLLRRVINGFLLVKLSVLLVNLVQFPVLAKGRTGNAAASSPGCEPASAEKVSLLVPMRNEAGRLQTCLPTLTAQQVHELLVLDDESDDDCAAQAAALLGEHPHARVVPGAPAPPGWVGKNWACHQLAAHATGTILAFCDADVLLSPAALGLAVAEMRRQRAQVFSVFPGQITASVAEGLIMPLIDDVLLCLLPFALLSVDVPSAATANGSLVIFTRHSYDQVGGFAAVAEVLVEDVALARLARAKGLKLGLALGGGAVRTRMYTRYGDAVHGLARGLLAVTGGSRLRLALGLAWHAGAYTLPLALAWRRRRWLTPLVLGMTERAVVELKTGRGLSWQLLLSPLSPLAATPVIAQAMRRSQHWKGRSYA